MCGWRGCKWSNDGAGKVETRDGIVAKGDPIGEVGHEVEVSGVERDVGYVDEEVAWFWLTGHRMGGLKGKGYFGVTILGD